MKLWPPKPGFTVMSSTMSQSPSTYSTASSGVDGLSATAGLAPGAADRLERAVQVGRDLGVDGQITSAPALREGLHVPLRLDDHEVDVEGEPW